MIAVADGKRIPHAVAKYMHLDQVEQELPLYTCRGGRMEGVAEVEKCVYALTAARHVANGWLAEQEVVGLRQEKT
jgi:hypothetical protein